MHSNSHQKQLTVYWYTISVGKMLTCVFVIEFKYCCRCKQHVAWIICKCDVKLSCSTSSLLPNSNGFIFHTWSNFFFFIKLSSQILLQIICAQPAVRQMLNVMYEKSTYENRPRSAHFWSLKLMFASLNHLLSHRLLYSQLCKNLIYKLLI